MDKFRHLKLLVQILPSRGMSLASVSHHHYRGCRGRMVVGFRITYAFSAYHH